MALHPVNGGSNRDGSIPAGYCAASCPVEARGNQSEESAIHGGAKSQDFFSLQISLLGRSDPSLDNPIPKLNTRSHPTGVKMKLIIVF
jgi:hypothetical protein